MKIVHICSDYSNQSLYKNMILSLEGNEIHQTVFVPTRTSSEINKYNIDNKNTQVIYKHILKKIHRILFNRKINLINSVIKREVNLDKIELIHSHFLFSDGAVALKIKKEYNIPYVVTVRNTDINIFFKYFFHLRIKGEQILLNSEKIIFITPKYKDLLLKKYVSKKHYDIISKKIEIIPNGLDDFWLNNKNEIDFLSKIDKIKLLYVGDFTANKNIKSIIESVLYLHSKGTLIHLTIVGGGGYNSQITENILKKCDKSLVTVHKRTSNKQELLNLYRSNNLFIMPSFKETFGIVYLEAMSQGLPIIYSQNQGIDGYFKDRAPGYSVDPYSINDIKSKILLAFDNYEELSSNAFYQVDNFSWKDISKKYNELYSNCINNNK